MMKGNDYEVVPDVLWHMPALSTTVVPAVPGWINNGECACQSVTRLAWVQHRGDEHHTLAILARR